MISEYLEDIFAPLGKKAGIAPVDMSLIYTPQIVASLIQVPVNWFLTELGARIFDAVVGVASAAVVATGGVKGKDAAELSEMASYWLTNIYVPPAKASVVAQQAVTLATSLSKGDMTGVMNTLYQGQNAITNMAAATGLLNPASYSSGTLTPISVSQPASNSSVTVVSNSSGTTTATDPIPRTSNQKTLSFLV